tara:strand:+ start:1 stop:1104 length:1104 start_codon:yes stop_codon:yes gene_type:complete
MQLKMQEEAESDIDLGYIGQYSKMRCTEVKEVGDRLQCNYDKYSFKDPLAQSAPRRKAMEKKRQGRHRISIQRICGEEDPFLCAKKDRDDNPKERNKICKKLKACPEPEATVKDIINDSREFFKLIISAMDFGAKNSGDNKRSAEDKAKMIEKLKKEIADIKGKYAQLKVPGAPGAPAVPQKGGLKRKLTRKRNKVGGAGVAESMYKTGTSMAASAVIGSAKDLKTIGKMGAKAIGSTRLGKAIGSKFKKTKKKKNKKKSKSTKSNAKCDGVMPSQELEANIASYKKCKKVFKERFPEHGAMIKNYRKKEKMLNKLDKSSKGMLGKFRKKIAGKIAGKVMSSKTVGKAMQVGKKIEKFAKSPSKKKK